MAYMTFSMYFIQVQIMSHIYRIIVLLICNENCEINISNFFEFSRYHFLIFSTYNIQWNEAQSQIKELLEYETTPETQKPETVSYGFTS